MFRVSTKDYTLILNRGGVKTKLNYNPVKGMMFRRQLPEYMQYLAPKGESIWRDSDQDILLIGGGLSNIRQWLRKIGVQSKITNVDFYTDYKSTVSHKHFKEDFYDWDIPLDCYDQEWALWSLPTYALSKTELEAFFIKAVLGLKPNGILRVFPINRCPGDMNSSNIEYPKDQRKYDTIRILKKIEKLGFNVKIFYPQDMEYITDKMQMSDLDKDKKIYDMFIKYVSNRRRKYIEKEFEQYQNKPKDKNAIAVNITAPIKKDVKHIANVKLNKMLCTLRR